MRFAAAAHDESVAHDIAAEFPGRFVLDLINRMLRALVSKSIGESGVRYTVVSLVDLTKNPIETAALRACRFLRPRRSVGQRVHRMLGPFHAVAYSIVWASRNDDCASFHPEVLKFEVAHLRAVGSCDFRPDALRSIAQGLAV